MNINFIKMKKIITATLISIFILTSCNNDKKENKTIESNTPNVSTSCFSADYEKPFEGVISFGDLPEKQGSITFKKVSCTSCNIILSTGETIAINNLTIKEGDGYLGKTKNGNIRIGRIRGTNKKGIAVDIMDNDYFHFKAPDAEMN
jgi:PBP1b-binding outer membrane lipoprotein LpoB